MFLFGAALAGSAVTVCGLFRLLVRRKLIALREAERRKRLPCPEPAAADRGIRKRRAELAERDLGLKDLNVKETLGTGTFSRVRLALLDNEPVAVKIMNKGEILRLKQVSHVNSERSILLQAQHPFVVEMLASFATDMHLYLVNEFCPGGELFFHLRREGYFPAPKARFYAAELASALYYFHSRNIVFREIKPENFVLDAEGHLRLVDFGFCKVLSGPDARTYTLCGTPEYLAPEIILNKGHGLPCDWWAFGIFVFEMLHGYPAFYGEEPFAIYHKIMENRVAFDEVRCDATVKDLLQRQLVADPAARLGGGAGGAADVMVHAWFADTDWAAVVRRGLTPPFVPSLSGPCDTNMFEKYDEASVEPAKFEKAPTDLDFAAWH